MKASQALSQDHNRDTVGSHAGSKLSDINNSSSNLIKKPYDEDHDGKPDVNVSQELSEDTNRI